MIIMMIEILHIVRAGETGAHCCWRPGDDLQDERRPSGQTLRGVKVKVGEELLLLGAEGAPRRQAEDGAQRRELLVKVADVPRSRDGGQEGRLDPLGQQGVPVRPLGTQEAVRGWTLH